MKWKERINRTYAVFAAYVVIVAVIIILISRLADSMPDIFLWFVRRLNWLAEVLKPIFFGFVFAYLTRPLVLFFEKRIQKIKFIKRYARGISVIITLLLIMFIVAVILSALVFSITEQLSLADFDSVMDAVDQMLAGLDEFYKSMLNSLARMDIGSEKVVEYVEDAAYIIVNTISSTIISMINSIVNISSYFTTAMFSIIIGIYFMMDAEMTMAFLARVRNAVLKKKISEKVKETLEDLHQSFSGYIQGQLCDMAFMMFAIGIALTITGVKFSAMIGIFTGLANLIPYLGPFVAYFLTALVCLVNGEYQKLLISFIVILIIQGVDGNFIEPKFLSRSIKIHPLLVIIFLIIGSAIGGLGGMLLSVPVGGYIKVQFVKWLEKKEIKQENNKNTI